jgi:hypothetical protein
MFMHRHASEPSTPTTSSPRVGIHPVTIDASGRIFYTDTGEQIVTPGLEPERVQRSIEDDKAGRGDRVEAETREEFLAKLDALCEGEE